MSLTYASWVTTIANLTAESETDPNFIQILPSCIDYAEQRLYRELDLLATMVRDSSSTVTANSRNFTLPSPSGNRFVTVDGINIYTPVNTTTTRNALTPVSRDVIDWSWPSNTAASATTVPNMYCWVTDGSVGSQTVILGPPPGANFTAEVIGTIRPTPLSSTNTTTFLTLYLPDLYIAASMIYMEGAYHKNFQVQSDDQAQAASWEGQYKALFQSADVEEFRKKYASVSWTPKQPSPTASIPQRG